MNELTYGGQSVCQGRKNSPNTQLVRRVANQATHTQTPHRTRERPVQKKSSLVEFYAAVVASFGSATAVITPLHEGHRSSISLERVLQAPRLEVARAELLPRLFVIGL